MDATSAAQREACQNNCIMPSEYVTVNSGPNVQQHWDRYMACMEDCRQRIPLTYSRKFSPPTGGLPRVSGATTPPTGGPPPGAYPYGLPSTSGGTSRRRRGTKYRKSRKNNKTKKNRNRKSRKNRR